MNDWKGKYLARNILANNKIKTANIIQKMTSVEIYSLLFSFISGHLELYYNKYSDKITFTDVLGKKEFEDINNNNQRVLEINLISNFLSRQSDIFFNLARVGL